MSETDEKDCVHAKFTSDLKLVMAEVKPFQVKQLTARLRIMCAACKKPFVFNGPMGFSVDAPSVSPDCTELRAPISWPLRDEEDDDGADPIH